MTEPTLLMAARPFSLLELDQAWGGIEGIISLDGFVIGGATLTINASLSVVSAYEAGDPDTLFEGWPVYNTNDGAVGVSLGFLQGKWSVDRQADLFTQRCSISRRAGSERLYSSDPTVQQAIRAYDDAGR